MRVLMCVLLLVVSAACSNSPTAPSPVNAVAGPLRWDVLATACPPVAPPSSQPDLSTARIQSQSNNSLTASWPYTVNGRSATLYATFIRENGVWAMCSWDTADL